MYRHGRSSMSQASFMAEVDMASEDIFSGPISESVPTSSVGFMHRRDSIAESTTDFTYYDEEEHAGSSEEWMEDEDIDEEAIVGVEEEEQDDGSLGAQENGESNRISEERDSFADQDTDVEPLPRRPSKRRKSSGYSRSSRASRESARDPLLKRSSSQGSNVSNTSGRGIRDRNVQKLHIQSEDMTIVIAGFRTSIVGMAIYVTICLLTGGLGYLLLRWLPQWWVKIVGKPSSLKDCTWVVVEVRFAWRPVLR